MDVRYINPFIASCRGVFDKMIHVPVNLGKPFLKNAECPDFAVSAVIGLSGSVTGSVVLGFSEKVALALASGLLGSPLATVDSDCVDALGEIANMIAGGAKKDLPGTNNSLSLPNVILGTHRVAFPTNVPSIIIPCDTAVGKFVIEISIRPAPAEAAAPAAAAPAAAAVAPAATEKVLVAAK